MDPHSFIARAEAQRWLGISEKLLMSHDFVGSKTFAIRARESDPRLEDADQILAITDTILAAEKRVTGNNGIQQPDYYAVLQLARFVQDTEHINSQYRRLALALNPNENRFAYSDQAFQIVNDAYAVLSNPMRKSMYDSELDLPHQQVQMNNIGFNIEHQHQQHHQHHQQQHQHNFFSLTRELSDSQQAFQLGHQQQQQMHQHNFLSQNPVRSIPQVSQVPQAQLFQQQVPAFQITSAPLSPMQQSASLFSWPQAPSLSQTQPNARHVFQQQHQSVPGEAETAAEAETETVDENVDDSPSFWTTCPYCFYMYEYPRAYADCVLRCHTCKRAFQAVRVSSPPEIVKGQESYFCCWGFFPLAVSMSDMQKNNGTQTNSNWAPFSPMYDVSSLVKDHLKERLAPKIEVKSEQPENDVNSENDVSSGPPENDVNSGPPENDVSSGPLENNVTSEPPKKKVYLGPTIYIDDETDDIFEGISESSGDDTDIEWGSPANKKAKKMKKNQVRVKDVKNRNGKSHTSLPVSSGSSKKISGVITRRQSVKAAKEMGRLDLNVEFNNNDGEERSARTGVGNRGNVQGDGDNVEGVGFFEGLDEFLSSLPILVNDDKVKAG